MTYISKGVLYFGLLVGALCGTIHGNASEDNSMETRAMDLQNSLLVEIQDASFSDTIASGVVVVDFYADWCQPCKKLAPIFEKLSIEMQDSVVFAKINVDVGYETMNTYKVKSIPTIILFKDGVEVARNVGAMDIKTLRAFILNHI